MEDLLKLAKINTGAILTLYYLPSTDFYSSKS